MKCTVKHDPFPNSKEKAKCVWSEFPMDTCHEDTGRIRKKRIGYGEDFVKSC